MLDRIRQSLTQYVEGKQLSEWWSVNLSDMHFDLRGCERLKMSDQKTQGLTQSSRAKGRFPQTPNQAADRVVGCVNGLEEARDITLQIEQAPCGEVPPENLSHQMDVVQRRQHLVMKPSCDCQSLVSPFVRHTA